MIRSLFKFVRDAATREGAAPGRVVLAGPSRASAPVGDGVLPPAPSADRGLHFTQISVEPAIAARVTPYGYPGCACAPVDVDGPLVHCSTVADAAYAQPTNPQSPDLAAGTFEQPTPVGLGRGTP